nr:tigger transposable element-derived protein 1-like [Pogona vitticeps]
MCRKKPASAEVGKPTRGQITLEMKKEIIRQYDGGKRIVAIAREYGRNSSTIGTIVAKREKILAKDAAKGVTRIAKNQPAVLEEVEKLLVMWMQEKQSAGDTVTEPVICEKARALYTDLVEQQPGTSAEPEEFKASRGWFERFKIRSGIHSMVRHGEAASSNVTAAEDFAVEFLEVVTTEGYLPEQVFNCDETCLFWKRMPNRTFLTQEESKLPGHKPMKDRLTLFCANASGDLKIKPLLVYHSENPWAFKKHKVDKAQLRVMWRSNAKAWVTRVLFVDWVNHVFGPAVKRYLVQKDLPLKVLLLIDKAPAHPPGLENDLLQEFGFIRIMFLPPNTTPLLQPMDQQVIANFKKNYTKEFFWQCFRMTEGTNLTLSEFWKEHFDIDGCLKMITRAWDSISQRNLNSAWRPLWPDCVATGVSAPAPESTVMQDIVALGRNIGLEVAEEDICELVEGHDQELTTQELVEMQGEAMEEEEEEDLEGKHMPTRKLKEILGQWQNVQTLAQRYDPNTAKTQWCSNLYDETVMSHFKGMLNRRQRQLTMDRFISKRPRQEKEPAPSTSESCDYVSPLAIALQLPSYLTVGYDD